MTQLMAFLVVLLSPIAAASSTGELEAATIEFTLTQALS